MTSLETCGSILTIDLDAIAANWRLLNGKVSAGTTCAAVVKANAYGLGIAQVAPALAAAGCGVFFVASIDEGVALRTILPKGQIHVLNGLMPGTADVFIKHRLIPALGSLAEIAAWSDTVKESNQPSPADIHVDTGMARLGLSGVEVDVLTAEPERLAAIDVAYVISHLACAEDADHPMNSIQHAAFSQARIHLPMGMASLANSSGIFLGTAFHFDLVRPGAAIYGIAPQIGMPNPMAQVLRLQGKIIQVREIDSPQTVGYGATHRAAGRQRIATVAAGYADGYPRSLSNAASGYIGDIRVPLVGRVSMDLITFDVTAVPESQARPGVLIDLIGPHNPIDATAGDGATIAYEMLTRLGSRYHRIYTAHGAA